MTRIELFRAIELWASQRNIIKGSTSKDQGLKLFSELGEAAQTLSNMCCAETAVQAGEHRTQLKDDIGDSMVVLTIIAAQEGLAIEECMQGDAFPVDHDGATFLLAVAAVGRLADSLLKNNKEEIPFFIGAAASYLEQHANLFELSLDECLTVAYNEIKTRRGVMYNGSFIKSTDARYGAILDELGIVEE